LHACRVTIQNKLLACRIPVLFRARQTSTVARIRKGAVSTPILLHRVASLLISSRRFPANKPSSCICVYILSPFNGSRILCHMMAGNQSNLYSFGQLHKILISDCYIPMPTLQSVFQGLKDFSPCTVTQYKQTKCTIPKLIF